MSPLLTLRLCARNCIRSDVACILLAALIGASTPASRAWAAQGLTLADAQNRAIQRSPQLAAWDLSVVASRHLGVAAARLPDPVVKFGIDNLPVNGSDRFSISGDFMTMRRVGVMQEIPWGDKRRLRGDRHQREAQKKIAEKELAVAAIERETALAWLERHYAEAMAAIVDEHGEQARLEVQAAEGNYRAARGSQADIFAARSALAAFDDRRSELERRVRNAKTVLSRWVGEAGELPLADKPDTAAIRLDAATLEAGLDHHPQIAVLQMQEELARSEALLAAANKRADWSVELAYQQRGPAYSNMLSIGVSVPLQWDQKNRQDRELAARLAMVEQAKAEREEMRRNYVNELRVMIDTWQNARERHGRFERELVPLANHRVLAVLTAYRGGKSTLADVLAARRNVIDVRIQALQLETDAARLWARINFLLPRGSAATRSAPPAKDAK